MPIYRLDGAAADKNFHANPTSRWFKDGIDVGDPAGSYAVQRLNTGLCLPRIEPKFSFSRSDSVFAIGSCFARGIEAYLRHRGFPMLSAASEFDQFELLAAGRGTPLGFTNKYNTFAIRYALEWALDSTRPYPDQAIVQLNEELWVDPHTTPTLAFANLERTRERRRILDSIYARVRECRVVIITLGLIEAWFDRETALYLNMTPLPKMRARAPGRFECHVLDYAQNYANLEAVHALLSKAGHPDVQIVVTVSPVPLQVTFTGQDVVIANAHSKSMLRTAAEAWAAAHDNVHYFPSYEIVTLSDRALAWEQDGRHVRGELTLKIMDHFTANYCADG